MLVEPMERPDATLGRVILSWPTVIDLKAAPAGAAPRSWIQLARTGSYVSKRYGKFSITTDTLKAMLVNFNTITPKSPTKLPVDYDHLSMAPKQPSDGIAAGWMSELELRNNGTELWARVEWTPEAAKRIEDKEYQFVSPSFVTDHTTPEGKKIGATLLAAAITNHPFLQGMAALTLYNFSSMGDLALAQADATVVNLADVGQRVTFIENEEATPELSPEERAQVYIVKAVGGGLGEDEFVKLETAEGGVAYGWYPVTVLAPAPATKGNPLPPQQTQEVTMHATDTKTDEAMQTMLSRIAAEHGLDLSTQLADVLKLAGTDERDKPIVTAYQEQFDSGAQPEPETRRPVVHNCARRPDEGFAELVTRVALEQRIDLRAATRMVSEAHPEMAEAYARGEGL